MNTAKISPSVVICMTTFNRIDCARINMEIIKLNYPFQWPIVHACSNPNYTQYLEDVLVKRQPKEMQEGALDLLISSLKAANQNFSPDFILHVESDTWLMNQAILDKYIQKLEDNPKKIIACSRWNWDRTEVWKKSKKIRYFFSKLLKLLGLNFHIRLNNTLSSQFFIIKNDPKIIQALKSIKSIPEKSSLESVLMKVIKTKFGRNSILFLRERDPVHPNYRNSCESLELYCQHSPKEKIKVLQKYPTFKKGTYMKKLLTRQNIEYYNPGARKD